MAGAAEREIREYVEGQLGLARKGRPESWAGQGEQWVYDCPLCGKVSSGGQRRFYVSADTGQWKTFCCAQTGNLITLRRQLGHLAVNVVHATDPFDARAHELGRRIVGSRKRPDLTLVRSEHKLPDPSLADGMHAALLSEAGTRALSWLKDVRGLTDDTILAAKLGFRHSDKIGDCVAIPLWLPDGRPGGIKYRRCPWSVGEDDTRFAREPGCPTVLYGAEKLGPAIRRVTIYEAEIDRLSGDQMGLPLGLGMTAGATGWQEPWTPLLSEVETVYLALDDDTAGDDGCEKIAEALGRHRCLRVRLPVHDVNDCLVAGLREELLTALASASPMPHPQVVGVGGLRSELMGILPSDARGRPSGLPSLDLLLGGRRGGEITVVTGDTGHGKTTWTTWLAWQAATLGEPALIGSFEFPTRDAAVKLATMQAGTLFYDLDEPGREAAILALESLPLYLIDAYAEATMDSTIDALQYAYHALGVRTAVIDHLHFLVDQEASARGDRQHEQAERFLTRLAKLLNSKGGMPKLHVYLVVHPKEAKDGKGNQIPASKHTLNGGSSIRQIADNIAAVRRATRLDGKHRAYVVFDKVRHVCGTEGDLVYAFDRDSLRYSEIAIPTPVTPPQNVPAHVGVNAPVPIAKTPGRPRPGAGTGTRGQLDRKRLASGEKEEDL